VEAATTSPARAVRQCSTPERPPPPSAPSRTFLNLAHLPVRAALEGRPDRVRQAVLLDPNPSSTWTPDAIWEMCDELTAAHGDVIPAPLREPAGDARRDR